MNEQNTENALRRVYALPEVDNLTRRRIVHRASRAVTQKKSRQIWVRWVTAAALTVATMGAYPVVDKNLLCRQLANHLTPTTPYKVSLMVRLDPSEPWRRGINGVIWNRSFFCTDALNVINTLDRNDNSRRLDMAEGVAVAQKSHGSLDLFNLPMMIAGSLSTFGVHKDLTELGDVQAQGRTEHRYQLRAQLMGLDGAELHVDAESGLPTRLTIFGPDRHGKRFDGLEMQFDYSGATEWQRYARLVDREFHVVDMNREDVAGKPFEARPLVTADLGRDKLTVYDFKRMPNGSIFLLYTFSGYHDGRQGTFLRLRDRQGHQWLTTFVDLEDTFKIAGHQPVGQVFFPPLGVDTQPTDLFVKHQAWEVFDQQLLYPESERGLAERDLFALTPNPCAIPPDWFYFNRGRFLWPNYQNWGTLLQADDAIDRRAFAEAASSARALLPLAARDPIPFIHSEAEVDVTLYEANLGLGKRPAARDYLRKAISLGKPYDLSTRASKALAKARKTEHL